MEFYNNEFITKKIHINNLPSKDKMRTFLLSLYPEPSLFETCEDFQNIDGENTIFMLNKIWEIKLVNNNWYVYCDNIFSFVREKTIEILNDSNGNLWDKLRQVINLIPIPKDYPIQIAMGYSMIRFIENIPNICIPKDKPEILIRIYKYIINYKNSSNIVDVSILNEKNEENSEDSKFIKNLYNYKYFKKEKINYRKGSVKNITNKLAYLNSVNMAKQYIKDGEIYQIQLSREMHSDSEIPPITLYEKLVESNPAPYMAYIDLGEDKIISSSPELMIKCNNREMVSRPIAGTILSSELKATQLNQIPKEAAEHLMLVDLARNDLARCASAGTVTVPNFMNIEKYGELSHLVSTIKGILNREKDIWDVIISNFPAGTMTGAPKVRAIEIISELEDGTRGFFTGTLGYITRNNMANLSLIIRTIIGNSGRYELKAAAGIVYDSIDIREWDETGNKINSFSKMFGGIK